MHWLYLTLLKDNLYGVSIQDFNFNPEYLTLSVGKSLLQLNFRDGLHETTS